MRDQRPHRGYKEPPRDTRVHTRDTSHQEGHQGPPWTPGATREKTKGHEPDMTDARATMSDTRGGQEKLNVLIFLICSRDVRKCSRVFRFKAKG